MQHKNIVKTPNIWADHSRIGYIIHNVTYLDSAKISLEKSSRSALYESIYFPWIDKEMTNFSNRASQPVTFILSIYLFFVQYDSWQIRLYNNSFSIFHKSYRKKVKSKSQAEKPLQSQPISLTFFWKPTNPQFLSVNWFVWTKKQKDTTKSFSAKQTLGKKFKGNEKHFVYRVGFHNDSLKWWGGCGL